MAEKVDYPKLLSFERRIAPSDGIFFGCRWDSRNDENLLDVLRIEEKAVRGTISNQVDLTKDDAEDKVSNANIQSIDCCMLPGRDDTLKVQFTVKFLSGVRKFSSCNSESFAKSYSDWVNSVLEDGTTVKELALRYAQNLANGRFLWRNRVGADEIEVIVQAGDKKFVFNAYDYSAKEFRAEERTPELCELAGLIEETLSSKEPKSLNLTVQAFARLGAGQEVFPSQEMVRDTGRTRKDAKSRFLYSSFNQAAMHCQKIGNAIRTVDTWYSAGEESLPIAAECYGAVTTQSKAYRIKSNDFYTFFKNAVVKGKELLPADRMYVLSVLLRGGVFGDPKEA